MRKLFGVAAIGLAIASCTPAERQHAVNTIYDMGADKMACMLVANLTKEEDVMKFCAIEERFRPVVRDFLAGKAAGARANAEAPKASQ